jgi:hypothetical protein
MRRTDIGRQALRDSAPKITEFVDRLRVDYLDQHPMAGRLLFDTSRPKNYVDETQATYVKLRLLPPAFSRKLARALPDKNAHDPE